ncbi:hypothetical protein E2C01_031552 [Portunus trituberculatus]|uniref:Uncharacterized protein n=1 Tax=Portunus trituberculatus TaxID=210409 RepID=A0A5B7ETS3_PORTR|nr:hypothetical protein [Portunus trituberculatus]
MVYLAPPSRIGSSKDPNEYLPPSLQHTTPGVSFTKWPPATPTYGCVRAEVASSGKNNDRASPSNILPWDPNNQCAKFVALI